MAYADGTTVPVEKTVAELVGLIRRSGGAQIAQFDDSDRFVIAFSMQDRQVRFVVMFDPPTAERFGRKRVNQHSWEATTNAERLKASDAHRRQRMRALLLVVKAKLESVESEVETFEQAFLANVVMANGQTVYDRVAEPIALEYKTGTVQPAASLFLTGPQS